MREATLRDVLLVRSAEEADPHGAELPLSLREDASRAAVVAAPDDPDAQLAARAARLLSALLERFPRLDALRGRHAFSPSPVAVALLAFVLGLLADSLGRDRALNLLAFPLFALLAWNLGVAVAWLLTRTTRAGRGVHGLGALWSRLPRRLGAGELGARIAVGFASRWLDDAASLVAARWRLALHLGALGFALGVVASLYVAGFAFAYAATWESTFLHAAGVERLLGIVLGPAAWLLGMPLPDVAGYEALRAPASGPAAAWIHRFALTVVLAVGAPRALLAGLAAARARGLAADLPVDLDAPYYARLLAAGRGDGTRVAVLAYSTELSSESATQVLELAHHLFGNRAWVEREAALAYGDDAPESMQGSALLVFALAQSPEREVHGRFARALDERCRAAGGRLLVVLDGERYASVVDEARLAERRRAWRRVLEEVGLGAVDLAPDRDVDAVLEESQRLLRGEEPGS